MDSATRMAKALLESPKVTSPLVALSVTSKSRGDGGVVIFAGVEAQRLFIEQGFCHPGATQSLRVLMTGVHAGRNIGEPAMDDAARGAPLGPDVHAVHRTVREPQGAMVRMIHFLAGRHAWGSSGSSPRRRDR